MGFFEALELVLLITLQASTLCIPHGLQKIHGELAAGHAPGKEG